ncbi:unnamed protein product [Ostreobium quekettii]|uniref:Uncharacterized protein n=1 Tax=Ostreobium quekettii TaxID=121088 RepID=A0A8S1JA64_9CHLO|nr:unnamed protein product [Ostreobium quekettii]CAD7704439.1 unnamed protein product [Ostreobium quekettii]|eukprot:evm.model.scf_1611.3 EVM.evm.TU.scf_1611.3   scf_1611:6858-11645(+)
MQALAVGALRTRAWRLAVPTSGVSRAGRASARSARASGESGNGVPPAQESSSRAAAPVRDPAKRGPGGPRGEPIKVVPIETAGKEAWAGVAAVDKGEDTMGSVMRVGLLVVGDAVGLLIFAAIGRISHGEVLSLETIGTVLPFWIGWFAAAGLLGGYGKAARGEEGVLASAGAAAKCWAVGTPAGLLLRSLFKGQLPPTSFAIVSCVATGAIMVGWRTALTAKAPLKKLAPETSAGKGNRKGNAFEFLSLLGSLTKRW